MEAVGKFFKLIDERLEYWMITVFYSYFILIIVIEVILRYGVNTSTVVGEETARHAFIWLSWVAASVAVKKRIHIKIAFLEYKVSRKRQFQLNFLYNILFILFCAISIRYVIPIMKAQVAYETLSRAAQIPMWIPYTMIPIGAAYFGIEVIAAVIDRWNAPFAQRKGLSEEEDPEVGEALS